MATDDPLNDLSSAEEPADSPGTEDLADDISFHVKGLLAERLHAEFPFMKTAVRGRIVDLVGDTVYQQIYEQEQAMATTKAAFDFFNIPAELQNRIYSDVLASYTNKKYRYPTGEERQREVVVRGDFSDLEKFQVAFHWPALLCINKQIRNEAMPIFLDQAKFVADFFIPFDELDRPEFPLSPWLRSVGNEHTKFIKKLVLRFRQHSAGDLYAFVTKKLGKMTALNKRTLIQRLGLGKYGVPHEAFEIQYDQGSTRGKYSYVLFDEGFGGQIDS